MVRGRHRFGFRGPHAPREEARSQPSFCRQTCLLSRSARLASMAPGYRAMLALRSQKCSATAANPPGAVASTPRGKPACEPGKVVKNTISKLAPSTSSTTAPDTRCRRGRQSAPTNTPKNPMSALNRNGPTKSRIADLLDDNWKDSASIAKRNMVVIDTTTATTMAAQYLTNNDIPANRYSTAKMQ